MPEIRVGNIHVSSETGIRIDSPAPVSPVPEPSGLLRFLANRLSGVLLVFLGLASAAVGVTGLLLATPFDFPSMLLPGALLTSFGLGLSTVGLFGGRIRSWARGQLLEAEGRAVAGAAQRLRPHLRVADRNASLARLAAQGGLAIPEAIRALRWMRDVGEIDEELDLDSGEFYYCLVTGQGLDARQQAITGGSSL